MGSLKTEKNSCFNYEHYQLQPFEYIKLAVLAMAACGLVAYAFYKSWRVFLLLTPFALWYPFYKRKDLAEQRKRRLLQEFKEGIMIISSFLGAGYSTENAFQAAIPELVQMFGEKSDMVQELRLISKGIGLNKPLEQQLSDFAERSGIDDICNFAEIFVTAKRSGGELVKIISHTAEVIRDKAAIEEEIYTMTAAKRYEQKIMNLIPFFIILYMNATSPDFFAVLYESVMGRVVMSVCLFIYLFAMGLADRIMDIEV